MGGDLVVITNLQRMRRIACGSCHTVCPWQPMATTSWVEIFLAHQRQYGIGKQPSQTRIQTT
jgi:formate hydrogenlyase subunit 6/NADH:ubiquinone oxidoreductase subunit I